MTTVEAAPLEAVLDRMAPGARLALSEAEAAAFAHDIFQAGAAPFAVVRPQTLEALAACVAAAGSAGRAIVMRGGGATYTRAYTPDQPGALLIDTSALDRIVAIDAGRMTVTVEPGVTWAQLRAALKPLGLRPRFWGPYSGAVATIGGSLSTHAVSMGSGLHETSATGVIDLEIIDAAGRRFHTNRPKGAFLRAWGSDLTGLFLGDCGVLGVKGAITLGLVRDPAHVAACSFAYPAFEPMLQAAAGAASMQIGSEMLGLDPDIQKGFLGAMTPKGMAAAARAIWSSAPGPISAALALANAARAAGAWLSGPTFALHVTVEGWSRAETAAKIAAIRKVARSAGAEIANAAPLMLRGQPFLPLTPILPPGGGRWLPTHGVFAYPDALAFHQAYEALLATHAADFATHGVRQTRMFVPVGANALVYEPTLYWPDGRHPAHGLLAPKAHQEATPILPDAPAARAFVFEFRRRLTDLMDSHGAQHFQLGRWYAYASRMEPRARRLLQVIKAELDPKGLFNPGALEL